MQPVWIIEFINQLLGVANDSNSPRLVGLINISSSPPASYANILDEALEIACSSYNAFENLNLQTPSFIIGGTIIHINSEKKREKCSTIN